MDRPQSSVKYNFYPTLPIFLIPIAVLAVYILLYNSHTVFLYINNNFHTPLLDTIMPYMTMMGEIVVVLPVIIITAFADYKRALGAALSCIISFIIIQSLKEFVFADSARPAGVFANDLSVLHIVENTDLHSWHSFPSGHTTAAFAWCISLAFYFNKTYITLGLLLIACLTGWSRIYLAQHFAIDVVIGGSIGISSSSVIEIWISKTKKFKGGGNFMTLFRKK